KRQALAAMTSAARALCLPLEPSLGADIDGVGAFFDAKIGLNGRFDAASPGGHFSRHFAKAREMRATAASMAQARQSIEEAQLFIDAAHAFHASQGRVDRDEPARSVGVETAL
ncbi:MAG TPA: hypothetical protein VFU02_09450, partial [Polyangiaceae bacterium]|nr:hypothetical protein [Polyangiaceae bacterium]